MSRPKRFLFYTLGDSNVASSRVRAYWVAEELTALGATCELFHGDTRASLIKFAWKMMKYDVIVFQKQYSRWHCKLMWLANRMGKTTVIDLDDSPSRINNPTTMKNAESMMSAASAVVVGSPNLHDYAIQHSDNVVLIPSSIRLQNYEVHRKTNPSDQVCLGWIGNGKHYCEDLVEILVEPLTRLASKHAIRFKLVGACGVQKLHDTFGAIPNLEIDFHDSIEWSDPAAVTAAISDFDIGLYPLLPKDFNHFKCGFKALEYMAIGIPVVGSPVSVTDGIVEHGVTGFLPADADGWVQRLEELIVDADTRRKIGTLCRTKVETEFNTHAAAIQLLKIAN